MNANMFVVLPVTFLHIFTFIVALCGFIWLRHRICADAVLEWDGSARRLEGFGASVGVFRPLFCR